MLYMFHIPTTIGRQLQGFNYVIHVSHTYYYREAVTGV